MGIVRAGSEGAACWEVEGLGKTKRSGEWGVTTTMVTTTGARVVAASPTTVDVDEVLRKSGDFTNIEEFKQDQFDVTTYVSGALREASAHNEVKRLDSGILALSDALKGEIVSKFEGLIKQVACVDETGDIIASVKEDVRDVHQIARELSGKVKEPQRKLKQLARQLKSTRGALRLVSRVSAYLKLVKKLRAQMDRVTAVKAQSGGPAQQQQKGGEVGGADSGSGFIGELAKAAKILKELRTCQEAEEGLGQVTVVANHAV